MSKLHGNPILLGLIALVGFGAPSPAQAQDWAVKMFDTTSHDFQTVARGAKAVYSFKLKNLYEEPVHISVVRSSCGCTAPRIVKADLKTFEVGEIVAELNTRSFTGYKSATITVTFDRPFPADVQLDVTAHIRSDVVVEPGELDLGTFDAGQVVERKLHVAYAGRDDWKIVDAKTRDPHFEVELHETARGGGQVAYDLLVRLTKDAPPGYIKDQLILVTNDGRGTEIPVDLEGRALSAVAVSVSPASLFMGAVEPGEKVTKVLIVRGKQPFRITSIECKDKRFSIAAPKESKALHQAPVVFTAGDKLGKVTCPIVIHTDQGDEAVAKCSAFAEVVAQPAKVAPE